MIYDHAEYICYELMIGISACLSTLYSRVNKIIDSCAFCVTLITDASLHLVEVNSQWIASASENEDAAGTAYSNCAFALINYYY